MSSTGKKYAQFGAAIAVILLSLGYLAFTGVQQSKSYYVTISELRGMGNDAYAKRLRVAGNVQAGSIKRLGTHLEFTLVEQDKTLPVEYTGTEAPPDTFKDESQALAEGTFGKDGVFHAKQLQAKCASKYAPADQKAAPAAQPSRAAAAGSGS
jgi:cytochrome c-type biogenesis protein CcmE